MFPPGRYGRRREPRRRRRWTTVLLAVAGALVTLAIASRLYYQYGLESYDGKLIGYTDISDSQITVRFHVYKPADRPAVCHVRALDRARGVVGRADVEVPAGQGHVVASHTIGTSARAVAAELVRCGPPGTTAPRK